MSNTFSQFEDKPGLLQREMFDTLSTGEVREIVRVQDVSAGTMDYYRDGAAYTVAGTVADFPKRISLGEESVSVDGTTAGSLTPPANAVAALIFIYDRDVVFTLTGTTPVSGSIGITVPEGGVIELESSDEIADFLVLRDSAGPSTAELYVTYYNVSSAIYGNE